MSLRPSKQKAGTIVDGTPRPEFDKSDDSDPLVDSSSPDAAGSEEDAPLTPPPHPHHPIAWSHSPPPPLAARKKTYIRCNLYCVQMGFCLLASWMILFNVVLFLWYGMGPDTTASTPPDVDGQDIFDRLPLDPDTIIQHLVDSLSQMDLFLYDPEALKHIDQQESADRNLLNIMDDDTNNGFSWIDFLGKRKFVLLGLVNETLSCTTLLELISGFVCGDMTPNVWLRPLPDWSTVPDLTVQIHLFNPLPLVTRNPNAIQYYMTKPNPAESFIHKREDLELADCGRNHGIRMKCPKNWDRLGAETSRFLECNWTRAELFYDQFPEQRQLRNSPETQRFRLSVRLILEAAGTALDLLGIPFWISSSAALGWHRQCDVVPYSRDADIGIWAKDYNPAMISALEDAGFELKMALGRPEEGYQLAFYSKGVKLDIYFFYDSNGPGSNPGEGQKFGIWNAATRPEDAARFRYWFPEFETCWTTFLEILVRVPCPIQPYIEANYGPDWFDPRPDWKWDSSAANVEDWDHWPEETRDETVQVFGISLDD